MILTRTPATELPFTFEDLKRHCRIDASFIADDAILLMYAWAVVRNGEFLTNRIWSECAFTGTIDVRPEVGASITIPKSPCKVLSAITYANGNGDENTLETYLYRLLPSSFEWDGGRPYAKVEVAGEWPLSDRYTFSFKAGWPGTSLPQQMQQWCFVKVSSYYEQKEDLASATRKVVAGLDRSFIDSLLDPYYLPKW